MGDRRMACGGANLTASTPACATAEKISADASKRWEASNSRHQRGAGNVRENASAMLTNGKREPLSIR